MKINYISDLHLEFDTYEHKNTDNADYLFLAGDIAPVIKYQDRLKEFLDLVSSQYKKVFWIPGNHEYYQAEMFETERVARELCKGTNVRFLCNETALLEDYTVIAGPLWTDLSSPIHAEIARRGMNDYRLITVFGKETISLTPEHTTLIHLKMVKMIEECQKDKIIVLGHHLPSYDCVHKQFEGSPLNCGFASNLDYLFSKVKFWIHGHTHSSVDFEKNGCRVLCNPKGYRKENLYGFDPTKSFTT